MGEMTLEQLVAIEGYADEHGVVTDEMLTLLIDFANAHLSKTITVAMEVAHEDLVGEMVSDICELTKADPDDPDTVCVNVDSLIVSITQTLTAALAHPRPAVPGCDKAERMLSELVDKIVPGLDTGDLLADAVTASRALDTSTTRPSVPDALDEKPFNPRKFSDIGY